MYIRPPAIGRRFFLRAAGVNLALPILDSLSRHVLGSGLGVSALAASAPVARPTRMVCIGNALGFYPPSFFPQKHREGLRPAVAARAHRAASAGPHSVFRPRSRS